MQECHIITSAEVADELSSHLSEQGAVAVTWQDAGDQPIYEPKPDEELHWNDIKLVALFSEENITPELHLFLELQINAEIVKSYEFVAVADQDWVRSSLDLFVPTQFGNRLWVCPTWHEPVDPDAINLMFDPGLAFGTGSHATTALCLEWLSNNIKGNETIIDYGCGSGILAIAALMLGAKHATAIDYDPQAILATKMNAEINHIESSKIDIALPDDATPQPTDIMIANIISKPLIELAPKLAALTLPNGKLVLSGILEEQVEDVKQAYLPWFTMEEKVVKDGWVRLVFEKQ